MIVTYKVKDHITNEMLESVGFRIVKHELIKAVRADKIGFGNSFIDTNNEINAWYKENIKDMIDMGWLEEVVEENGDDV
jgi:hypothetical protein